MPSPKDYMDVIASAVTRKFLVLAMQQEDFSVIKMLASNITNQDTPGFSTACRLLVDIRYTEGVYIKVYLTISPRLG